MTIVYVLTAIIVIVLLGMVVASHHPLFKMTSQTIGRIMSATEREVRDENERRDETLVLCKFEVRGQEYEIQRIFRGKKAYKFPAGITVSIKYNPAEPQMAEIAA